MHMLLLVIFKPVLNILVRHAGIDPVSRNFRKD
jgi:hypothetical protein